MSFILPLSVRTGSEQDYSIQNLKVGEENVILEFCFAGSDFHYASCQSNTARGFKTTSAIYLFPGKPSFPDGFFKKRDVHITYWKAISEGLSGEFSHKVLKRSH